MDDDDEKEYDEDDEFDDKDVDKLFSACGCFSLLISTSNLTELSELYWPFMLLLLLFVVVVVWL